MEIKVSQKQFIEIKGISHLLDYEILSDVFEIENQIIKGIITVSLDFYSREIDNVVEREKEINYQILSTKDKVVKDIEIKNLSFNVIDNQGVEAEFDIFIEVQVITDEIKQECYQEMNSILDESLSSEKRIEKSMEEEKIESHQEEKEVINEKKEEPIYNNNEEEAFMYDLEESYRTTKIIFTKNEEDINRICTMYNQSLSELYRENNYALDNVIIFTIDEL